MALIFADGFDNYASGAYPGIETEFWDQNGGDVSINIAAGIPRTGRGCLQIHSAAFGPYKGFASNLTHVLLCTNWNSTSASYLFAGNVMHFMTDGQRAVGVSVNANGSVSVIANPTGPGPSVTTVGGLVTFGQYNSIAVKIQNFTTSTAIITVWVNGVQVLHLTGQNANGDPAKPYCNGVQLMGPGGAGFLCYHDDFYCLDCSTAPNTTFLGALKLYAIAPTANGAVAWDPLAGTNWSEVNEVPPDDDTSYVSSANIGDVDQYVYPLTGPPANSSLLFVQHELDMKVDSGSRSVASDLNGTVAATATALSNGYHIYPTPYDVNPSTGVAFVAGDFPIQAGPKVTA